MTARPGKSAVTLRSSASTSSVRSGPWFSRALEPGLFWADLSRTDFAARACFFLACVLIAGVYGGLTANRRILYIQALPAAAALAAVWLS